MIGPNFSKMTSLVTPSKATLTRHSDVYVVVSVPDEIAQHQRSFIQLDPTDIVRDVVFPIGMIDLMVYDKGVHTPLKLATLEFPPYPSFPARGAPVRGCLALKSVQEYGKDA